MSIMLQQIPVAFGMMMRGVKIDRERRDQIAMQMLEAIAEREAWLVEAMPAWCKPEVKKNAAPWYRSPKQLAEIIYDTLGIDEVYNRKTKQRTTDDDALVILKKREPALVAILTRIQELRSLKRFHDVLNAGLDSDYRMRCTFNPVGAETFRWSSSKNAYDRGSNLQNISKGGEEEEYA